MTNVELAKSHSSFDISVQCEASPEAAGLRELAAALPPGSKQFDLCRFGFWVNRTGNECFPVELLLRAGAALCRSGARDQRGAAAKNGRGPAHFLPLLFFFGLGD